MPSGEREAPDGPPAPPAPAAPRALADGGVVKGRCVDAAGNPVPGVAIELRVPVGNRPERPRRNDYVDDETWYQAIMEYHRVNERLALGALRKSATDAEGRFAFAGVGDGNILLSVRPAGWLVEPGVPDVTRRVEAGEDIEFRLLRAASLRVRVNVTDVDTRGRIAVEWRRLHPDNAQSAVFVGANVEAEIQLVPGEYELRAVRGARRGGPVRRVLQQGTAQDLLELSFDATRGALGTIAFNGQRPMGLRVMVAPAAPGATDEEIMNLRTGAADIQVQVAADGTHAEFRWEPPRNGEYVFGAFSGDRLLQARRAQLGDQVHPVQFSLVPPQNWRHVTARIERPSGSEKELPRFEMIAERHQGSRMEVWTVSPAEYTLYFREPAIQEPPRDAWLVCSFQSLGALRLPFRPGFDGDLLFTFKQAASVQFAVKGPARSANVRFLEPSGPVHMSASAQPGAAGMQLYSQPMQPGSCRMEVYSPQNTNFPYLVRDVVLVEGRNTVEIDAPEVHTLRIDASAHQGAGFKLEQRAIGKSTNLSTGSEGIILLTEVPPGHYRLPRTVYRPEETEVVVNFEVPTGGTVVVPK